MMNAISASLPETLIFMLRIVLACICGGAIGFERTRRLKEAGIRTHCIIAAASALLMIISVGQNLYKSIKTPVEKWGEKA